MNRPTTVAGALADAYAHGPGKSLWLPPRPPLTTPPATGTGRPLADLGFDPALVRALVAALAPRRFEPWNAHNDHRAYPSPRSLFLTDVVVRSGGRAWLVDPVRRTGTDIGPAAGPVALDLHANADRLPEGYGSLRDAAALLEAGHVAGALAEACAAAGIATTATPIAPAATVLTEPGTAVARLTVTASTRTWPSHRVRAARSAGLGPYGRLSADPRALPAGVLDEFIREAMRSPAGSAARCRASAPLHHRIAVHHIDGRPDGLFDPDAGAFTPGTATSALQEAFRYGPDIVDVVGMNAVWVITADLAAAVRDRGPATYPATLLRTGALAQHICSAAAAAGLFCRPVRSFDEPATEAAIGCAAGADAVYMLLIGRARMHDFPYDLTDPEDHDDTDH